MTVPLITSTVSNPFTGTFGNGVVVPYLASGTFVVPAGVSSVRVRVWGGGGTVTGGGGGFTYKTITGLISGASIAVTVGAEAASSSVFAGTSSFGAYCSATGGGSGSTSPASGGGVGAGGDINNNGGSGSSGCGGGVGGLFRTGGSGNAGSGNAGGGGASTAGNVAGNGVFGSGGQYQSTTVTTYPTSGMVSASIDFLGTGGGGPYLIGGLNGGGGGVTAPGGFPGGGGGTSGFGARGLVMVEY
jgi:hypothetical protein